MTDIPPMLEAIRESLTELKAYMPFAHMENTVESQYLRMTKVCGDYWRGEDYHLHIFDADDETRMLGCVGFHRRAMNHRALEIGYWIRTSATGRGICTRVVRAMLVIAFDHFDCQRVQCGYDIANGASARVAEKVGFRVEGDLVAFGPDVTDEMKADGWKCRGTNRMTALMAEEARALPWFAQTRTRLRIADWLGRPV